MNEVVIEWSQLPLQTLKVHLNKTSLVLPDIYTDPNTATLHYKLITHPLSEDPVAHLGHTSTLSAPYVSPYLVPFGALRHSISSPFSRPNAVKNVAKIRGSRR
ncbi:hypothetical protein E2C01_082003 [Portunus trituberculatus]|uniref:Uncharacterized protein n=1 Tax=Portunus trituberculatus TaxID=210409 RepID=A0A5B7INU8_PORTR|nr:hypothetical protein [Portunus trituberculatus]